MRIGRANSQRVRSVARRFDSADDLFAFPLAEIAGSGNDNDALLDRALDSHRQRVVTEVIARRAAERKIDDLDRKAFAVRNAVLNRLDNVRDAA
jgi:hypothetical protein